MLQHLKQSYFNAISFFVKKNPELWVFGAVRGEKYMDNAKYLFEYVNKNTDIQAVWLSKNPDVINHVRKKAYKAFDMHSKKGRYYAMHAKVAVITHRGVNDNADLPFYCFSKETKIIQLWHGIPLKKIGFDDTYHSNAQKIDSILFRVKQVIKDRLFPYTNYINDPSLVLALSEKTRDLFSQAFRVNKEKVIITGYPRNDRLLNSSIEGKEQAAQKKKIIYMPTYRNKQGSCFDLFMQYGFDPEQFEKFLIQNNAHFYIKLHPFNLLSENTLQQIGEFQSIHFIEEDDIYESLGDYDILITDFSSIYFDFLLTDKPIIFAPFDKESYLKKDREFYFNYDELTPGPQAHNWEEIMEYIEQSLTDTDYFRLEREQIRNKFHSYIDNHSTERVYAAITQLLTD